MTLMEFLLMRMAESANVPPSDRDMQILEAMNMRSRAYQILRAAAMQWDDHPDYDEAWRP